MLSKPWQEACSPLCNMCLPCFVYPRIEVLTQKVCRCHLFRGNIHHRDRYRIIVSPIAIILSGRDVLSALSRSKKQRRDISLKHNLLSGIGSHGGSQLKETESDCQCLAVQSTQPITTTQKSPPTAEERSLSLMCNSSDKTYGTLNKTDGTLDKIDETLSSSSELDTDGYIGVTSKGTIIKLM